MCRYTCLWYCCNHSHFIDSQELLFCVFTRCMRHGHSRKRKFTCRGFSRFYCPDCSEGLCLGLNLDEL
ncbi:hypothetical protein BS50DRAFT_508070 [Corynespora cassiicola Philippines]|uniref:Uncharacterized protein n=1 Tax=Corynespora cassiicola Philippines TaxID=1448308 RepID=A0A2T2N2D2_CORCC|nr:hypothetical protein BS50DRAFT_508070 [Corynespora cassiicola Philippines]